MTKIPYALFGSFALFSLCFAKPCAVALQLGSSQAGRAVIQAPFPGAAFGCYGVLSRHSKYAFLASGWGDASVLDAASGRVLCHPQLGATKVEAAFFTADESRIVVLQTGHLSCFDSNTGRPRWTLTGDLAAMAPDFKSLAVISGLYCKTIEPGSGRFLRAGS